MLFFIWIEYFDWVSFYAISKKNDKMRGFELYTLYTVYNVRTVYML